MNQLSLGIDSTLGNWLMLCKVTFGEDSAPTKFIEKKIAESPKGEQEEVIADERQLLMVLGKMLVDEMEGKSDAI